MDRNHPYAALLIEPRSLGPLAVGDTVGPDGPTDSELFLPDISEPVSPDFANN